MPILRVQLSNPVFLYIHRYCYNSTLSAFKTADPPQWERARALLGQMKEEGSVAPDLVSYSTAVQACLVASEWEAAESLMNDMVSAGFTPAEELGALVSACANTS